MTRVRRVCLALVAVGLGASCVQVKPWQREYLSRPGMQGKRPPGESRMEQHALGSREGADGGTGKAGGGCGCN